MLTEEQKQWLTALRSGNYKQAYGVLEEKGAYCCLGVACHLFLKDKRKEHKDESIAYDSQIYSAPMALVKLLGLRNIVGEFDLAQLATDWKEKINYNYISLAGLNDVANWDFTIIANFIEDNPEAVFTNVK